MLCNIEHIKKQKLTHYLFKQICLYIVLICKFLLSKNVIIKTMTSVDDHASNFFLKRQPPKVTTIITNNHESIKLVQSDVAAYKSKLELVFRTARACVSTYLEKERWIILLVDHFKLVDRFLTPEDIEYIYDQKKSKWTFECFITGLWDAAIRKYVDRSVSGSLKIVQKKSIEQKLKEDQEKNLDSQDTISMGGAKEVNALKKFLSTMFESPIFLAYQNEVPLTRWNETKGIERIFYVHEKILKRIFNLYAKEIESPFENENSPIMSKGKPLPYILYQKFIKFCMDFRFYPDKIDGLSLQHIFSTFDDRKDPTKFLLGWKHFWDAIIRFSIIFFSKNESEIKDSSPETKLLAFFNDIKPRYKEIFGINISEDLKDLSKIRPPNVSRIDPVSSTSSGNVLITIYGDGFDPRLGNVIMRFGAKEDLVSIEEGSTQFIYEENPEEQSKSEQNDNKQVEQKEENINQISRQQNNDLKYNKTNKNEENSIIDNNIINKNQINDSKEQALLVPCHFLSSNEVRCRIPPLSETGIKLKTIIILSRDQKNRDLMHVDVSNRASFVVRISNDSKIFSQINSEPVVFSYIDTMEPFTIDPAIVKSLHKIFVAYCQFEEPRNTQFLTVSKWKMIKYEMSKVKQLMLPKYPDILRSMDRTELLKRMRAFVSSDDISNLGTRNIEVYDEENENPDSLEFFVFAQQRMLRRLITFEEFVKLLIYHILFTVEDLHPIDFLLELASNFSKVIPKASTTSNVLPLEVIEKIEKEISLVQTRERRMLDIYSGAVLVGTIQDIPGKVQKIGETILTSHPHKFLSYKHYDLYTQNTVMKILEFSTSFDHFIHRILKEGFDIAAMHENASTRNLLSRCWTIHNSITNEKVATFWDYPGTIALPNWIPLPRQIDKPFTIIVYKESDFYPIYKIQSKATNVSELRDLLTRSEYRIRTSLYKFT